MKKLLLITCVLAITAAVEAQRNDFTTVPSGNSFMSTKDSCCRFKILREIIAACNGYFECKNFLYLYGTENEYLPLAWYAGWNSS